MGWHVRDDLEAITARVDDLRDHVVVLDFDGTLSNLVEHPDDALPVEGAVEVIRDVARLTDVVVVSGRPLEDLRGRLAVDGVTFVGGHGASILTADGRSTSLIDAAAIAPVLDEAERLLEKAVEPDDGWLIERKPASIALHHRVVARPIVSETLPDVRDALLGLADRDPGWELLEGKAVVELRPAGMDKGVALAHLEVQFRGRSLLVVGDDVTDEDAFRFAEDHDGLGVLVAAHPRQTLATYRLASPDRVVSLLRGLVEASEIA